jgi:hypothetical protein
MNKEFLFVGRVERKQITKGNRTFIANVLNTECNKEFILRRQGKSALEDPELDELDGKMIKCVGLIQTYALVLSSFEVQ